MLSKKKTTSIVGLDIDAGSIAATEVHTNGAPTVARTAVEPLAPDAFRDGEVANPEAVAEALRSLFGRNRLSKEVRIGVANQRVAFRTIRLPALDNSDDLDAAIRFLAQEEIPMPLESAVLEHQVIGGATGEDGAVQVDVAIVAARREMVARLLEPVRAAGLKPVGVDLSAFAMIRALGTAADAPVAAEAAADGDGAANEQFVPATLYCNVGDSTNLAIARGFACLFARSSTFGMHSVATRLAESTGLTLEHARQWMGHVGLAAAVEEIEGDEDAIRATREALERGAHSLADELRLSLDYYGARDDAYPVGPVVLSGQGSVIPGLAERLADELAREVRPAAPAALGAVAEAEAARLTVSYGLALEQ